MFFAKSKRKPSISPCAIPSRQVKLRRLSLISWFILDFKDLSFVKLHHFLKMIFHLPDLVLGIIQGFLTLRSLHVGEMDVRSTLNFEDELIADGLADVDDAAWRNLMNTTKQAKELKKKTIYLVLKDDFALRYMNDEIFRARVDGLVYNRRNQLQIKFRSTQAPFIIRNGSWDGCNKIRLSDFKSAVDLSTLQNVRILSLHNCQGNGTIYNMSKIEALDLSNCNAIESISNCPRLTRLNVYHCATIRDISSLTNLVTLRIEGCPQLTIQENTLQSVEYLQLGDETRTFPSYDMSSFKRLKYLGIMNKDVVLDNLWQLDDLLALEFRNCKSIQVTRFPKNLKELIFWESNHISAIDFAQMPYLSFLAYFKSSMSQYVIDVPQSLKSVWFKDCFNLNNIYVRSAVKEIVIDDSEIANSSFQNKFQPTTLWIKRGVMMPNLTLKDDTNFYLKTML